jgi:hypothetical protein
MREGRIGNYGGKNYNEVLLCQKKGVLGGQNFLKKGLWAGWYMV